MFLIVGEIIKDIERWSKDREWWIKNSKSYAELVSVSWEIKTDPEILWKSWNPVVKFWKLMEKEGYIHIKDLEWFRNDEEWWKNSTNLHNLLNWDKAKIKSSEISYIISRWAHFKYTREVLEQFLNLKKIFLFQIWNDNVDLKYCKEKWIEVVNFVSQKSVYSVAEQTVSSLVLGVRQMFQNNNLLRQAVNRVRWRNDKEGWIWERQLGKNLDENIVVGIMWFWRIGQKVAELLRVFPVKMIAYDVIFNKIRKDKKIENDELNRKTYKIIGLAMEVHNKLWVGLQEKLYHKAFVKLLKENWFSVKSEKKIDVNLDWEKIWYSKCDIVIDDEIAIELKSEPFLKPEHFKQLRKYVNFGWLKWWLLFNFFPNKLQYKRLNLTLSISILPKSFQISDTLKKLLNSGKLELTGDLNYFLQKSNYISVHIPWFEENLWLLNYSKLQNIDWVVNMARAQIVVEEDVLKLLDENKLEFYVSDVVEWEPYIDKINKKLITHPKVFITPHIWANTIQVQEDIMREFLRYYLG